MTEFLLYPFQKRLRRRWKHLVFFQAIPNPDSIFGSNGLKRGPLVDVVSAGSSMLIHVYDTFRHVKQYLGAEQPQSWKGVAPERAGAFSYMVYGAVWLARIEREGENTATIQREWYGDKECVSFLDALADLRERLWRERIIAMSSSCADYTIITELLVTALVWAA